MCAVSAVCSSRERSANARKRGKRLMFDIYLGGWQATAQVLGIALLIGAVLWVMSKVEIKEREDKENV
jgi:hypothetical protein